LDGFPVNGMISLTLTDAQEHSARDVLAQASRNKYGDFIAGDETLCSTGLPRILSVRKTPFC
jgi:hypothetical protein